MGNFVIRFPAGPIQPYGTVGLGVVRVTGSVDAPIVGDVVSASARRLRLESGRRRGRVPQPAATSVSALAISATSTPATIDWDTYRHPGGIGDLPLPQLDSWRVVRRGRLQVLNCGFSDSAESEDCRAIPAIEGSSGDSICATGRGS